MSDVAISMLGLAAAFLSTVAFVPQVIKVWKTRSARDISLGMYSIFVSGVALWLIYGVMVESLPLILGNIVTLTLALAVLIMKLRFG